MSAAASSWVPLSSHDHQRSRQSKTYAPIGCRVASRARCSRRVRLHARPGGVISGVVAAHAHPDEWRRSCSLRTTSKGGFQPGNESKRIRARARRTTRACSSHAPQRDRRSTSAWIRAPLAPPRAAVHVLSPKELAPTMTRASCSGRNRRSGERQLSSILTAVHARREPAHATEPDFDHSFQITFLGSRGAASARLL